MSVFHLKYRPTLLSDLDSLQAADNLKKILANKEILQSFLFTGPKGAGKTSAARILAKVINCENKKDGEACETCDNCKEILSGRSMDIIEMDAASNRGIEDVRNLKEKAYLSPSKLKYKVFIIDEVHMLTKDAFNALLKLIEEPPKHTIFILCTTDAEKIPDTVLSRLTRIDFKKGTPEELRKSLNKVIIGEKLVIEDKVIEFLIQRNDGSFRNLHRDFNELILSLGRDFNLEQVESFYSQKNGSYNEEDFEEDLTKKELRKILEKLEKMADEGVDFVAFRESLLVYFQKKLLAYFNVGTEKSKMDLKDLEGWINLLIRAAKQEKETEIDQLPLELAVIDFLGDVGDKRKEPKEVSIDTNQKKTKNLVEEREIASEVAVEETEVLEEVKQCEEKIITMEVTDLNLDKVVESWGNILMSVKPFNHSVEAFLRAARPIELDGRKLVLEVFYPFHKDRLEEARNRKIVENGLLKILGVELAFECILGKSKKEPLIIQNDTPIETVSEKLVEGKQEDKKDLYDVAKDIFG
jgi:DNA polymerase-3 subunit gamma/tau